MAHWIIWETASLFENIGVVQDGIETIARERTIVDAPGASPLTVTRGEIRFDEVTFNYGNVRSLQARGIVDHLSLTVTAGEKVGLVGRSGAGKSTLVSLLLRFYDLESGRILIDGQEIAEVTQESLRASIGVVTPQLGFGIVLSLFAAVIVGGIGDAYGALAGGILIGLVQEWSTLVFPVNLKVAVGFGAMILVLILRPEGIFGRARSAGR